jgi:RNA polymerase sigma-70 factor, ECF subfamily
MTKTEVSERETLLVLRAQSGSREALNELFKVLQEPLFRYLVSLVREQSKAEDILQEVFIRIYQKLSWLREPKALKPWAYQIATREAFRYLKRERRWSNEVADDDALMSAQFEPRDSVLSAELVELLPALIDRLSPASRAVIVLYYLNELSLPETAAVLEVPLGTVKSRLSYALNALRKDFRREGSG